MPLTASGNLSSLADTGYSRSDIVAFFNGLASKYGVSVESGDVDLLIAKLMGEGGCIRELGGDPQRCFDSFESQYARRGGPVGQGDTPNVGSAKVGGGNEVDTRTTTASQATTVAAPAAATPPSVGPTGLANPNLPVNYATNTYGSQYGYNGVGGAASLTQAPASGGSNMMMWLLLGGAALAAFFLLRK